MNRHKNTRQWGHYDYSHLYRLLRVAKHIAEKQEGAFTPQHYRIYEELLLREGCAEYPLMDIIYEAAAEHHECTIREMAEADLPSLDLDEIKEFRYARYNARVTKFEKKHEESHAKAMLSVR